MSKKAKVILPFVVFFLIFLVNGFTISDMTNFNDEMRAEFDVVNDELDAVNEQLEELQSMLERKT